MNDLKTEKWPKFLPPLDEEKRRISDDFMKLWLQELPKRFGMIERFNHGFPVKHSKHPFLTTLEIGAGLGEHLRYEKLTAEQERNYYALDMRENIAAALSESYPAIQTLVGDCQSRLDLPGGFFDRVIAVHVLEHLPDLPSCLREVRRLLKPDTGRFYIVIPTEGSPAYSLARKISAERIYKKRYGGDYSWFYKREHINVPREILEEIAPYFEVEVRSYFPFSWIPFTFCNLCIGLVLRPRAGGEEPV